MHRWADDVRYGVLCMNMQITMSRLVNYTAVFTGVYTLLRPQG